MIGNAPRARSSVRASEKVKAESINLSVPLTDVPTPLVCSRLLAEFIKYIAFQRQQIPYHFDYLRSMAERSNYSSAGEQSSEPGKKPPQPQQKKALAAYQSLTTILSHLEAEIQSSGDGELEEVMILLGSTLWSPKETYRIVLPPVSLGHCEKNHFSRKSCLQLLRCIMQSEKWCDHMVQKMVPTNLYVFVKSRKEKCDWFLPKTTYTLPAVGQHVVVELSCAHSLPACTCVGCNIFRDDPQTPCPTKGTWCQAPVAVRGFRLS